jgi:predicted alpha-1,2-mannosidase
MRFFKKILFICTFTAISCISFAQHTNNVLHKVDPFWGTNEGNIIPGVSVPFGMVKLSPNIRNNWTPTSAYRADEPIIGFSHTQTSGTGGSPRYGNILIIPQIDTLVLKELVKYPKINEYAEPGYYTSTLKSRNSYTRAELTASKKVGFHQYTFTKKYAKTNELNANFIIDVSNTTHRISNGKPSTYWKNGYVNIMPDKSAVEGYATFEGGWGGLNPYTIYFYLQFDQPFVSSDVWQDSILLKRKYLATENKDFSEKRFGAVVSFSKKNGEQVGLKVGISYLSLENAMLNLREKENLTFDKAKEEASMLWANQLNKIEVKGGDISAQKLFYSALRNTMLMPTDVTGEVPGWNPNTPHFWDFYCMWDVFRATMPLYTLIYPKMQLRIVNCMLEIYDKKGWLPDAWIADDYAYMQGGSNANVVLADAVVKKLGGFDVKMALQAVRKDAELQSDNPRTKGRYTNDYKKYGFVLAESAAGSVSRTLEYAYNDFCIAEIAKYVGKNQLAEKYKNQSLEVFKMFYPEHKMFWGKDSLGKWMPDFTPVSKLKDHWNDPYFYEGGSQIYSTYIPHDMAGLIYRHGGNKEYVKYLDNLFESGVFSIENEPEFLIPYQYIYAGDYPSTARRVSKILHSNYVPGANGLPGQDDSGSMSAWYVFSSMGFFPVAGQDLYLIGTPLFEETLIHLENKKTFNIIAKNLSKANIYVTKATLNGKPLNRAWFKHTEIYKGGKLVLEMSATPTDWGKTNLPTSLTTK